MLCKHSPQRAEVSGTASSGEKTVRCLSRFLLRMGMVLCKLSPRRAEKCEVLSTALYSGRMYSFLIRGEKCLQMSEVPCTPSSSRETEPCEVPNVISSSGDDDAM